MDTSDFGIKKQEQTNGNIRREVAGWTRWLHIYLSMFSFAILFFFAITGLTLNHTEWFTSQQKNQTVKGSLDKSWVNPADTNMVRKLDVVEYLRKTHLLKGALSDFIMDENQLTIAFSGPAYSADIFIERESGIYEISIIQSGFFGLMNDLHKGRDSGKGWSLMIDISAIMMVLVSLTGLILMFFLKKKRLAGYIIAIMGLIISYLVYIIWVP